MLLGIDADTTAATSLLDGIGDRLDNARPLLEVLSDEVHAYEADVFATNGNGAWPALSAETKRQKRSSRMLVASGDLLAELTTSETFDTDDLIVGSTAKHARFHKHGTSRMPRRDPAPEPPAEVREEWARSALDYIVDGRR